MSKVIVILHEKKFDVHVQFCNKGLFKKKNCVFGNSVCNCMGIKKKL